MYKEFLEKLFYFHPAIAGYFIFLLALAIALLLSVFGSRKLFREFLPKNPRFSWIASFIWYVLLFGYFFSLFFVLPKAFFILINIPESLLDRLDYAVKDAYFLSFSFIFLIFGGIWLFFSFKKEKISPSQTSVSLAHSLWDGTKRTLFIVFLVLLVLIFFRVPVLSRKETIEKQIAEIHSSKITLDDVLGKNLLPEPDQALNDSTLEGIDANQNGIRDDVELAIFEEYPDSAKTRAALLQYAKALQMGITLKIVNEETVTEAIREEDRADICVADTVVPRPSPESARTYADLEKIDKYTNFIKSLQFNTNERKEFRGKFFKKLRSYNSLPNKCDLDISLLPD